MGKRQRKWTSPNPVEPTAARWDMADVPNTAEPCLGGPPANHSQQTLKELDELRELTANRTPADVANIRHWSVEEPSPSTHWAGLADQMVKAYKLSPPAAARLQCLIGEAICCSMLACWRIKYEYLRPRPTDLDPTIDTSIIPVPQHPSYPSGHSTVGAAAAEVLSHFFPAHKQLFWAEAGASGLSRLLAGIHFQSDHTAGFRLGKAVAKRLVRAAKQDGGPRVYRLPRTPGAPPES